MRKFLTAVATAGALASAPVAVCALTTGGNVAPGKTFNISAETFGFFAFTRPSGEGAGTLTFDFFNDTGVARRLDTAATAGTAFSGGVDFGFSTGGTVTDLTGSASFLTMLAANETTTLTVSYSPSTSLASFGFGITTVPVPAGIVMLLTALGGMLVVGRRRKGAQVTQTPERA